MAKYSNLSKEKSIEIEIKEESGNDDFRRPFLLNKDITELGM